MDVLVLDLVYMKCGFFTTNIFYPSVSKNLKNNKCIKSILFIADLKLKQKSLSNVGYAIKQHWNLVVRAELFGFL